MRRIELSPRCMCGSASSQPVERIRVRMRVTLSVVENCECKPVFDKRWLWVRVCLSVCVYVCVCGRVWVCAQASMARQPGRERVWERCS
jgi:hypothetical protein